MENILPVSDLRFYNQTLSSVRPGTQVVLTKNGTAKYAVVDIEEWEKTQATLELLTELQKGHVSLKNEPLITREEFRKHFSIPE